MALKCCFLLDVRLLIPLSIVVTLASPQNVEVSPVSTNVQKNSANKFMPISKDSGNTFKNQYHIYNVESSAETEDDKIKRLDRIGQVITTSLLAFILVLLVENYISRLREGESKDNAHQVPYQVRRQRPVNRRQDLGRPRPPPGSLGGLFLSRKPVGVWLVVPKAAQATRRCDDEPAEEDYTYTHIAPAAPFASQATPTEWKPLSRRFGPSPATPPPEWRPGKPLTSRSR